MAQVNTHIEYPLMKRPTTIHGREHVATISPFKKLPGGGPPLNAIYWWEIRSVGKRERQGFDFSKLTKVRWKKASIGDTLSTTVLHLTRTTYPIFYRDSQLRYEHNNIKSTWYITYINVIKVIKVIHFFWFFGVT